MQEPGIIVAQVGAREHYSLASMAHNHGALERLITDLWNPLGIVGERLARLTGIPALIRASTRYASIPNSKVVSHPGLSFRIQSNQMMRSLFRSRSPLGGTITAQQFALASRKYLDLPHRAFFGYSGGSLELLLRERENGVHTTLGQVDAGARFHLKLLDAEEERFPELRGGIPYPPEEQLQRVEAEWETATRIVVNSEWSRRALIAQGVHSDKISVVPLTYQCTGSVERTYSTGKRLKVLYLGRLSLLKGFPYAREAARTLNGSGVEFTFAGIMGIPRKALDLPENASYIGVVPRSSVPALYRAHDIFLFPTLSDGFGMTQLEAMSHGVPVVATPCCASVVQDGESGIRVPPRDSGAIAGALLRLRDDSDLRYSLRVGALRRARDFAPERIWPLISNVVLGRQESVEYLVS